MKLSQKDRLNFFFILIITCLLVFDLFANRGQSANMDGTVHITTIAQYYKAMQDGEWFVRWSDGFANYGLPVPLFAHQLVSYTGGLLTFITHDAVPSFNILLFLGTLFSTSFSYLFLRLYFSENESLGGSVLFHFSAYRIINLYIRGAIHEYISAMFLPLILISLYFLINKRKSIYFFALTVFFFGLLLTHPMMIIIYGFIIGPYYIFLMWNKKWKDILTITGSVILSFFISIFIAAYYYIPLFLEKKYFYFGAFKSQYEYNQNLLLNNFFNPNWFYFFRNDVLSRGHFIKLGLIETIGIIVSIVLSCIYLIKRRKYSNRTALFIFFSFLSFIIIFFTTKHSAFFYEKIYFLGSIQFPWRMLSSLVFIPPFLFAYLFSRIKKEWTVYAFIILICVSIFPQLYGKNYTLHPQSHYSFTPMNLHSNKLNTIWTGETESYPIQKIKPAIIAGKGTIQIVEVKNSSRTYIVVAEERIRMADYTFYFPGWKVYIDGVPTIIEFQDMNYRGVITYYVPEGRHTVLVKFEDTKVRMFANAASVFSLIAFGALIFIEKKNKLLEKILQPKAVLK